jgi:hypothetical protein
VIAVCISPKVLEIICTGRLRESSWARRSRSYDAGSSKNGKSSAAAWSITISWIRIWTRSCSSCWAMLRRVVISELIAAIASAATAKMTMAPTDDVTGPRREKPGMGTASRIWSGWCCDRMTIAWTTALIKSLAL